MRKEHELRVQYMLPHELNSRKAQMPLIFLAVAPLEWHGPHLSVGTDPVNAEQVAAAVAERTGGVLLPTLYSGTERERDPQMLKSLGYKGDEYVVGVDHPEAQGIFKSFYFPEEVFALTVRYYIKQCISHGYKYIFIINGHGAVNQNQALRRLCNEFSAEYDDLTVEYYMAFPDNENFSIGSIGHADIYETSLLMFYDDKQVDLAQLPGKDVALDYKRYSIVDSGGFSGDPGENFCIRKESDPRYADAERGRCLFEQTVAQIAGKVEKITGGYDGILKD